LIVDPETVRSVILYDGPMLMETLRLSNPDPDPFDWLEGVEDDELVCMEWSNVSITMRADTARAWLENAVFGI